jgi:NAD-dependent deacetylase
MKTTSNERTGPSNIEKLKLLIDRSQKIVGFTGAGISTESGISDYRSKGGLWDRFTPVYYNEFLQDAQKRLLYWQRKVEMWPSIRDAKPNSGHLFFKRLYDEGKLLGLITQNIDGLHERSGLPEEIIVNLHGTGLYTRCLQCSKIFPSDEVFESLDLEHKGPPRCGACGGRLKPDTVSFGQNLKPEELSRAEKLAHDCDCMLCFGSTLVVYPAAGFPESAKRNGAKLGIVTKSETPLDAAADVVIHEQISRVVENFS